MQLKHPADPKFPALHYASIDPAATQDCKKIIVGKKIWDRSSMIKDLFAASEMTIVVATTMMQV
jgi:hypothetical protein